jgi:hypothetical protein
MAVFDLAQWTPESLTAMLDAAYRQESVSARVEYISRQFLNVPYVPSTLVGSPEEPEALVFNLSGFDCFTYIDYVEAMRLSRSLDEMIDNLRSVRYESGVVAYDRRRHFFSDWFASPRLRLITAELCRDHTLMAVKSLNLNEAGELFLPGIRVVERAIEFIPSEAIDCGVVNGLQTGDYIGAYTDKVGLDVSHVGIFLRNQEGSLLRHASSLAGKVVDQDFLTYFRTKPGVIVLRPLELSPADPFHPQN